MRKINFLLLSGLMLLSCTAEDQPVENKAPSKPLLLAPENDLFCTTDVQIFEWSRATDPEEDELVYNLEISEDKEFKNLFFSGETGNLSKTVPLKKGEDFYWRVSARDKNGNKSEYSAFRSLYTEAEATSNFLPTAAVVVSPEEGAQISGTTTSLEWTAEDADGDQLSFDLYFGKSVEPELLKENLAAFTYDVSLETGSTYYWKVIVKDEHGGITGGKVWSFTTE
ncbi:hypothetical protein [Salinimicrobium flavum]|uniref:Fibronectin type-III domain-containing protein n=1 Tax=Salinimicrobium flavum TaxID=1737065 RepID=A0ABW5IX35_9FLAO